MAATCTGIHQQDGGGTVSGQESRTRQAAGVHWPDRGLGPAIDIRPGATVLRHRALEDLARIVRDQVEDVS